ncbi:hypothetical protein E05_35790 [Plautia stali symbiont]|nr:hypothetical protein E05_35790 [Plautia stali symbiont]
MRNYKIAAIPADGIGPEVISAGVEVLQALTRHDEQLKFDVQTFDWGSDYYKQHGVMMPEDGLQTLKQFDAIYFGAVGAPDVPDHITLWGCAADLSGLRSVRQRAANQNSAMRDLAAAQPRTGRS